MRKLLVPAAVLCLAACSESGPGDILRELTLEEKVAMTHAQSRFSSPGVPRLGIPDLWFSDGPHGIRTEALWDSWQSAGQTNDSCTAFPALTCLAATWDRDLAREYGESVGEEARYRRKNVLLGPGVNIMRLPLGGRNFEYLGEDPFLTSELCVPYIRGVQSNGVAACVKHFALNNQETARARVNVNLDERTLNEIYLPAFKAAVKEAGVWAVMASYNRFKGAYCCENDTLLNRILKEEWGFDGVVISDWGGVHTTPGAALGGMDIEMGTKTDGLHDRSQPTNYSDFRLADAYLQGLRDGTYPVEGLDDKVSRILRLQERTNFSRPGWFGRFTCPEHSATARRVGDDGIVLLKNEGGILPLDTLAPLKILLVGENAIKKMSVGGGSSSLKTKYEITPEEGIRAAFPNASISFARGYVGDPGTPYWGVSSGQDLSESRSPEELREEAARMAAGADVVILIGGLNKSRNQDREGRDRLEYGLPYGQDLLARALLAANPSLVYVNISGNPVGLPWIDGAAAALQAWYLGSETGNSLADVLSGRVNPSGKLPFAWVSSMEDTPFAGNDASMYPGTETPEGDFLEESYSEGLYYGYRYLDRAGKKALFPFGHGLSYTRFEYSALKASVRGNELRVSLTLKNTGGRAGKETVQVYVSAPTDKADRPLKELKGFTKTFLVPGESRRVSLSIPLEKLGRYCPSQKRFVTDSGTYTVLAGTSAGCLPLHCEVKL